jgi:tetratricopeptide (TPR) repeat protein
LAKIRHGDLKEGREEIEIAASLDPDNSLIRSYLGKAYYDEKRDRLAKNQFAMAKELDPKDPTAWFYDAIRKQSVNRPVEALEDLQKSIELNDNRAVYRSRLMLDEDLAARSASLGRIYNDLGFQQLALVEGWKSVNTDPANYSAHRFLADSYAALPRHEIARVSELLQSQLLQPINITPVQPQLAESNLFILEGAGPSDPSFNEFNPLFLRNRLALQASGVAGGNSILGDELVQSGVWGRYSYSIGQFHYETDGFRKNNDQDQDIYNAFGQVALSYKTSVQAEYQYRDVDRGDLPLRFTDEFLPKLREPERLRLARFGFHHAFAPRSHLIGYLRYGKIEAAWKYPPYFEYSSDDEGYDGEIQHLFRSGRFNITSGAGYYDGDCKIKTTGSTDEEPNIRHTNAYVYSQINYPKNFTWTLGGSADFFKGADSNSDQFNPKAGLTWNIFPGTTFRAAGFRTLRRTLLSSQTIEPTQVAGFNQFFDDFEGTDAWRYGVGIDQRVSATVNAGAEVSRRDMEVHFVDYTDEGRTKEVDWKEDLARIYLYWTPQHWLALSAEYQFERFKRDLDYTGADNLHKIETHRFPLAVSLFSSLGFSSQIKATYIDQKGEFGNRRYGVTSGDDQFWIVDAFIRYRLPKRWGFITLEARNLFDEDFHFQDTDPAHPVIYPERLILTRLTLVF